MTDRRSQLRMVQVLLNRAHTSVTADYDDTLAGVLDAIDQALVETLDARAKLAPVITVSGHIDASQQWLDSLPHAVTDAIDNLVENWNVDNDRDAT